MIVANDNPPNLEALAGIQLAKIREERLIAWLGTLKFCLSAFIEEYEKIMMDEP